MCVHARDAFLRPQSKALWLVYTSGTDSQYWSVHYRHLGAHRPGLIAPCASVSMPLFLNLDFSGSSNSIAKTWTLFETSVMTW